MVLLGLKLKPICWGKQLDTSIVVHIIYVYDCISVGFEVFADRLSQASKSESYAQAVKKPYITAKDSSLVFFDHEFTKLYKSLEVQLLNSITKGDEGLCQQTPCVPWQNLQL